MCIEVSNLNKFYGQTQVLFDLNFSCKRGETLVLLGPSGAGKSTLLKIINLLEHATSGQLGIAGEQYDFGTPISEKQGLALRRQVGMVFQQYHLWPHMTVLENLIEAPTQVSGLDKTTAIEQATALLKRLQLTDKAEAWPLQLSGGQQQRVAIARALMMKVDTLLFDEPTSALDPEVTTHVTKIIKELSASGLTQIIVTHDVAFARKIASHFIYMEKGKIIETGTHAAFSNPVTTEFADYLTH